MVAPLTTRYKILASSRKEAEDEIIKLKNTSAGIIIKESVEEKHKDEKIDGEKQRWVYFIATVEVEFNKIKDVI